MTGTAIYLDTNALIAIVEAPASDESGIQRLWEKGLSEENLKFHTSELSLAELLVIPYRDRNRSLAEDYISLFQDKDAITVHPVTSIVLDIAAVIRSGRKMKLPDAIHLATASYCRCSHLLTFDSGFSDLDAQSHPHRHDITLSPVQIIRPDPASLSELSKALQ